MMKALIPIAFLGFLWCCQACNQANKSENGAPNILIITADDLGLQLGCYGDTIAQTPNIDELASNSILFTNAYTTQSSGSPSHSSILTGTYPHQNGQIGLAQNGFTMHRRNTTLPEVLKRAGYRNGLIGKLHVKPEALFPFDYELKEVPKTRDVKWVAEKAREFIRQDTGQFFLYVNFFDPHTQGTSYSEVEIVEKQPAKTIKSTSVAPMPFQKIDEENQLERISGYYNCIKRLDTGIKLLIHELKKSGKYDNTLIIFIGDNGAPFTRSKATNYEAGVKIPFLLKLPNQSPITPKDARLISTIDIVPTILDVCHIEIPENVKGFSLRPLYLGESTSWRSLLFTEFTFHTEMDFYPRRAVRNERYKLIYNILSGKPNPTLEIDGDSAYLFSQQAKYEGSNVRQAFNTFANPPEYEFYDLQSDPVEFYNQINNPKYEQEIEVLQAALIQWMVETNDFVLRPEALDSLHNLESKLN